MSQTIDVPLIVNGEAILSSAEYNYFEYPDLVVRQPMLTAGHVQQVTKCTDQIRNELIELSTAEVTAFLSKVGQRWLAGDLESVSTAIRYCPQILAYPSEMVESDFQMMGDYLRFRTYLYDQIAAELGHEHILDDWIPLQASYVRAFPAGFIVHYLVGNLPMAGLYSLIRASATKNVSLAKLPSRDPLSSLAFPWACSEVDPTHPISRAMTACYWNHDSTVAEPLIEKADVVCTWGGEEAILHGRRQAPAGARVLDFGPRWSASAIDLDEIPRESWPSTASRLVSDACYYDQEACLSSQAVFIKGPVDEFEPILTSALDAFADRMPVVSTSLDLHAYRRSVLAAEAFAGNQVSSNRNWAVVTADRPLPEHPLARTVVLVPVDDLAKTACYLNKDVQTIGVLPWAATEQLRNSFAAGGCDRIVEVGFARHARHGYSHDGMRSMNWLVRIVSNERPGRDRHFYKYGDLDESTMEQFLFVPIEEAG